MVINSLRIYSFAIGSTDLVDFIVMSRFCYNNLHPVHSLLQHLLSEQSASCLRAASHLNQHMPRTEINALLKYI